MPETTVLFQPCPWCVDVTPLERRPFLFDTGGKLCRAHNDEAHDFWR